MSSKSSVSLEEHESAGVKELRQIVDLLGSPDMASVYTGAGQLVALENGKSLLPKSMTLLNSDDLTVRKLAFRAAGLNLYGKYIKEFFGALEKINPAEREQVLQGIEEKLERIGSPESKNETMRWIKALATLGREHQPTVFGIMAQLNRDGARWVKKRIQKRIETISIASLHKLDGFNRRTKNQLIKLLIDEAIEKRSDLILHILEIMGHKTMKYALPVLKRGGWHERAEVAGAIGSIGIRSSAGIIMDVIADTDWRVKQALLEKIDVEQSKLSSLMKILGYVVNDSHSRVRGAAGRVLLKMGALKCKDSTLKKQRARIEKKFRKQLLRAAPINKDIDSSWLGIDAEMKDPIPIMNDDADSSSSEEPVGVSLDELMGKKEKKKTPSPSQLDLLSTLRLARKAAVESPNSEDQDNKDVVDESDPSLTTTDRLIAILKRLSSEKGKNVSIEMLESEMEMYDVKKDEFENTLAELEKNGIVYKSGKNTVSYVDMEL